jgi:hypothetical protein
MGMTKDYSRVFKLENEPSKFVETPVVRKRFRVTIDVEAALASGPQGGMLSKRMAHRFEGALGWL